jgi:hypothetical protein
MTAEGSVFVNMKANQRLDAIRVGIDWTVAAMAKGDERAQRD